MIGAVVSEPVGGRLPLQPPDAVQAVAFCDDHVNVAVPPLTTAVALAVNVTLGGGGDGATEIA